MCKHVLWKQKNTLYCSGEHILTKYYFFPHVRAVNVQLGRGSARFSHFLGSSPHWRQRYRMFLGYIQWIPERSPKGREPSPTGAVITYFGHVMFLIRAEMLRLASNTNSPRTNPPEDHTQSLVSSMFFTLQWLHSCHAPLSCSPAASGRYFQRCFRGHRFHTLDVR